MKKPIVIVVLTLALAVSLSPTAAQPGPALATPPSGDTNRAAPSSIEVVRLAVADATIMQTYPNDKWGGLDYMSVTYLAAHGGWDEMKDWALVRFNLSLPANARIDSAQLELWCTGNAAGENPAVQSAWRIIDPWDESTVNWNNRPAVSTPGDACDVGASGRYYFWDVTAMAQGWYRGTYPNYGIAIQPESPAYNERSYRSRESPVDPVLRINYTLLTPTPTRTRTRTATLSRTPTSTLTPGPSRTPGPIKRYLPLVMRP